MSAQLSSPGPYQDAQEPTAYAFASSGPFDVDEQSSTVAHHVQVSVIPSWVGTTQIRTVQFSVPSTLVLSAVDRNTRGGVLTMYTYAITWSRQLPR